MVLEDKQISFQKRWMVMYVVVAEVNASQKMDNRLGQESNDKK